MAHSLAAQFVVLPQEVVERVMYHVIDGLPIDEAVSELKKMLLVSVRLRTILLNPVSMQLLMARVAVESTQTSLVVRDGRPFGADSILFRLGVHENYRLFCVRAHFGPPLNVNNIPLVYAGFLGSDYTIEESDALKKYCTLPFCGAGDRQFAKALLSYVWSKGMLFDLLLQDMVRYYCLEKLSDIDEFEALYQFRSLEARHGSIEEIVERFERFKVLVPFFIEMCRQGFILQNVRYLIDIQLHEFASLLLDEELRYELTELCHSLADATFYPADRDNWRTHTELQSPMKRIKVSPEYEGESL